mmetsp:Transcript_17135/g.30699  ORF Transcript_17135/g.30699 Transcript_17135/m.30699 type:complete len:264 (-) Transcript_17135:80-871(-)
MVVAYFPPEMQIPLSKTPKVAVFSDSVLRRPNLGLQHPLSLRVPLGAAALTSDLGTINQARTGLSKNRKVACSVSEVVAVVNLVKKKVGYLAKKLPPDLRTPVVCLEVTSPLAKINHLVRKATATDLDLAPNRHLERAHLTTTECLQVPPTTAIKVRGIMALATRSMRLGDSGLELQARQMRQTARAQGACSTPLAAKAAMEEELSVPPQETMYLVPRREAAPVLSLLPAVDLAAHKAPEMHSMPAAVAVALGEDLLKTRTQM